MKYRRIWNRRFVQIWTKLVFEGKTYIVIYHPMGSSLITSPIWNLTSLFSTFSTGGNWGRKVVRFYSLDFIFYPKRSRWGVFGSHIVWKSTGTVYVDGFWGQLSNQILPGLNHPFHASSPKFFNIGFWYRSGINSHRRKRPQQRSFLSFFHSVFDQNPPKNHFRQTHG